MARKRKESIIKCADCGIEVLATHNRTKFCPECSAKKRKGYRLKYMEKRRQERMNKAKSEDGAIHHCDSPERIQACLNCEKPECNNCFDGAKGANVSRPRKPMVHLKDIKDDLVHCIKCGDSNKQICKRFNISPTTLSRWVRQLKEEGVLE